MQERPLVPPTAPPSAPPSSGSRTPKTGSPAKAVQPKSSFRRLSDVLQPGGTASNPTMGGKKDLWLVSFNDVVLRCQRTGTTTLPLASSPPADGAPGRAHSLPELQSKGKYNTVGRRSVTTKPRNLYKFIKVSIAHYLNGFILIQCSFITSCRSRPGQLGMLCNLNQASSQWKSKLIFISSLGLTTDKCRI